MNDLPDAAQNRVFTIPPTVSFADALVKHLIDTYGLASPELTKIRILLPTRRACRVVRDTFLRLSDGKPTLLPQLQPLGDVDEDELFIEMSALGKASDMLDMPPALTRIRRQILMTRIIMNTTEYTRPDQALDLASALGKLMDQIYTEDLDMANLQKLVPEDFADHWQITIEFLRTLTEEWPGFLESQGVIDYADRRNRLIKSLATHWQENPPAYPVIAAGSTGSIPATSMLLKTITGLPQGQIILPGLDQIMDDESWDHMDYSHPQATLKALIGNLDIHRRDVALWPGVTLHTDEQSRKRIKAREWLATEMMRPVATADKWMDLSLTTDQKATLDENLNNIRRIDCPTSQDEAHTIAFIMRKTLEQPGKRVALITPDRILARRIAAACRRWGITLDDSAGHPIADTALGAFIHLSINAALGHFKPSTLLALLKSSYCTLARPPGEFGKNVQRLEAEYLRGPRPQNGLEGLKLHLAARQEDPQRRAVPEDIHNAICALINEFEAAYTPLNALSENPEKQPFKSYLKAHIALMEALAQTEEAEGQARLWKGEAGETAATFFASLMERAHEFPKVDLEEYYAVLSHFMKSVAVRPKWGLHPRLAILGQLEARLIQADLVILAGLNEGTWPPDPGHDPWMSRPMKEEFGLPSPERSICLAAHDFVQGFCAENVIVTRAQQVDGTPQIPARWLQRLDTVLQSLGIDPKTLHDPETYALAKNLDQTNTPATPISPPAPCPPADKRPDSLYVTAIETWMTDPYAIYAKYILGFRKLAPLEEKADAALRGNIIHKVMEKFIARHKGKLPADAYEQILEIGRAEIEALNNTRLSAFWWPRFERLARWFIDHEEHWRQQGYSPAALEATGALTLLADTQTPFTIKAKADRIDTNTINGAAAIIDYKTGGTASAKDIALGYKPQLPLEAAILSGGGFENVKASDIGYIGFWKLSGGSLAGEDNEVSLRAVQKICPDIENFDDLAVQAQEGLTRLVTTFQNDNTPYHSLPRPDKAKPEEWQDYRHLARVPEWAALDDAEGGSA